MTEGFLHRKFIRPILALLGQGVTPEKIALSIAMGVVVGVVPVLGSTTILCTIAAMVLRLNLPSIQLVNWFSYPLQIVLLVPFMRLGGRVFGAAPVPYAVTQIIDMVRSDAWAAIAMFWQATLHALAVWACLGSVGAIAIYFALVPVLRRLSKLIRATRPEAAAHPRWELEE